MDRGSFRQGFIQVQDQQADGGPGGVLGGTSVFDCRRFPGGDEFRGFSGFGGKMAAGFLQDVLEHGEFARFRIAGGGAADKVAELGGVIGERCKLLHPDARGLDVGGVVERG